MFRASTLCALGILLAGDSPLARAQNRWQDIPPSRQPLMPRGFPVQPTLPAAQPEIPLPPPPAACIKFEEKYSIRGKEAEATCQRVQPERAGSFEDPAFDECVMATWFKIRSWSDAIVDCTDPESLATYNAQPTPECAKELRSMGFWSGTACTTGVDSPAQVLRNLANPTLRSCVLRSISAAYGYYLWLDRIATVQSYRHQSVEEKILSECAFPPRSRPVPQKGLAFIGEEHIHTKENFKSRKSGAVRIGGLSGLTFDPAKQRLHAVTDSKETPYILSFDLRIDPSADRKVAILPVEIARLSIPHGGKNARIFDDQDWEDVALLPDGSLILSSEVDSANSFFSDESPKFLSRYDAKGNWLASYAVSDALRPTAPSEDNEFENEIDHGAELRESAEEPVEKKGTPIQGKPSLSFGDLFSPPSRNARPLEFDSPPIKAFQMHGVRLNNGIEAIALKRGGKTLLSGVEAPLYQDEGPDRRNMNRIFEHEVTDSGIKEAHAFYWYRLEEGRDNGLSAMTALDDGSLLTLERRYDPVARKLTVRIFHAKLQKSPIPEEGGRVLKTLVMDLDDLVPSLAAGFRKLENFEGMTVGPRLSNGNPTLVLVSDNNFSAEQRTTFLVFEMTGPLAAAMNAGR